MLGTEVGTKRSSTWSSREKLKCCGYMSGGKQKQAKKKKKEGNALTTCVLLLHVPYISGGK